MKKEGGVELAVVGVAFEPDIESMAAELGIRRARIEASMKRYLDCFLRADKFPASSKEHGEWMKLAEGEIRRIAAEMKEYNAVLAKVKKKVEG